MENIKVISIWNRKLKFCLEKLSIFVGKFQWKKISEFLVENNRKTVFQENFQWNFQLIYPEIFLRVVGNSWKFSQFDMKAGKLLSAREKFFKEIRVENWITFKF